jgi:beta-lactamase class C
MNASLPDPFSQNRSAAAGLYPPAVLLAQAVRNGDLGLDHPVAKYVVELQHGGDIRQVTLGQLATHTSSLLLPQDHPPWPDWGYTLPEFIHTLNTWKADRAPGQQHLYTHAGFVLLQLALERRYAMPIDELIDQRVLQPLGMISTMLHVARARTASRRLLRGVQGKSIGCENRSR